MKSLKKLGMLSAGVLTLSLAACGGAKCPPYMRDADEAVYAHVLGNFASIYSEAKAETQKMDLRFVKFAEAEAALMDSATFMPTTTQGGNYAITRVAYRTVPYSMWGNDTDRLRSTVVAKNLITKEQRASLVDAWKKAKGGEGTYDPKAILEAAGQQIADTYATTFNTFPETLDILNTSMAADTESLVNAIDGLIEYDNLGNLHGRCAEDGWEHYAGEEEGTEVWEFTIKSGLKWYNADGTEYGDLTAQDFVDGFHHMLDAQAGLEYLTQGVIVNADEYINGKITDFDKVGVKAEGNKLYFTLCQPESFFDTRLTYSCFMPLNKAFFESKGGAFGIEDFKKASAKDTYKYGVVDSRTNMVYNGVYHPTKLSDQDEIVYELTEAYSNGATPTTKTLKWIYDDGSNPDATYQAALDGDYSGVGLSEASGLLAKAKDDGNFAKYSYQADTNAVTYFGGFNVNRGTFETGSVKSDKNEAEKIYTHRAMQNKNFRLALQHAWDRVTWNAVSVGEDAAKDNLRNIYTAPEFVAIKGEVKLDKDDYDFLKEDHTFAAGTQYGDLVEYFLKNEFKRDVTVKDGQDGWYNPELAKDYFENFKEELGENMSYPIIIDVEYYAASKNQTAQAQAFKKSFEDALGKENVEVNLMAAATTDDYYAAGYRAANGEKGNFDVFYGSGWGPDYGDPSTYLDTFLGDGAGYMCKVIGLF